MIYTHEWVQVSNGTMEYIQLKDDLSEAARWRFLSGAAYAPWAVIASKPGRFALQMAHIYKVSQEN